MRGTQRAWAAGLGAAALAVSQLPVTGAAHAAAGFRAVDDSYSIRTGRTLSVSAGHGVFGNDRGRAAQLVSSTRTAHGTLTLNADGSFSYKPDAGFTGDDTFTYTATDAAHVYPAPAPAPGTFGGVTLTGGAYGSALTPVPGSSGEYYGLTDRGPNVDLPDGSKGEPLPDFTPAIGKFKIAKGRAVLKKVITLKDRLGRPYNGQASTEAPTGEVIRDLAGNALPASPNGYDSEGLVALPDGSFWVSDEYGPFITHFDGRGRAIERLSPQNGRLPAELARRVVNRGMEGLTITPDGRTLVGIMQSALQQPDLAGSNAKNITPLRIVTYDLRTRKVREFLYLLDNPKTTGTAVSEITALSGTEFLVDERDGSYVGPGAYKRIFKIDISKATDVGPAAGSAYDATKGGYLVGGKSLELLLKGQTTDASQAALKAAGITTVTKTLQLDVNAYVLGLDPSGKLFAHDKLEGLAVRRGGREIVISNDSDFGIDGVTNTAPPFLLHAKVAPATARQDDGQLLIIDTTRPAITATATVTIHVTKHR